MTEVNLLLASRVQNAILAHKHGRATHRMHMNSDSVVQGEAVGRTSFRHSPHTRQQTAHPAVSTRIIAHTSRMHVTIAVVTLVASTSNPASQIPTHCSSTMPPSNARASGSVPGGIGVPVAAAKSSSAERAIAKLPRSARSTSSGA